MPPIRRMINPIIHRYSLNQKGIYAFQASDVVTILIRVRAALVVCVDAALGAKIVLRCICVELIKRQEFSALHDFNLIQLDGGNHRAFSAADRTVAASGVNNAVG